MNKIMVMIAVAGLLAAAGCASRENQGGTSDQYNTGTSSGMNESTGTTKYGGGMNTSTNDLGTSGSNVGGSQNAIGSGQGGTAESGISGGSSLNNTNNTNTPNPTGNQQ